MKSKKAKSVKKSKKDFRKKAQKELQDSLASRFMDVIKGLGHSSEGLGKVVRKSSKRISRKLTSVFADVLQPAKEKKLPEKTVSDKETSAKLLKPVAKKELVKARKVVARAGTGPRKNTVTGMLSTSAPVSEPVEDDIQPPPEGEMTRVARLKTEDAKDDKKIDEDPVTPS
jgi:hypothetical protein